MKKTAVLVLLMLVLNAFAFAQSEMQACDLARQMAQEISEMADVKQMPLENGAQNRAIWTDTRAYKKCALVVYADADEALRAAVEQSTRNTAARNVDNCALFISCDLGIEAVDAYRNALAELLETEMDAGEPVYILNVNSHRLHKPDCRSVADMKETNRLEYYEYHSDDRDFLVGLGYAPCGNCKP